MSTAPGHDHGIRRAIATVCLSAMPEDKFDAVLPNRHTIVLLRQYGAVQGSRVFFEVVPRVGADASYGSANRPSA